jgi:predicted secreted protein
MPTFIHGKGAYFALSNTSSTAAAVNFSSGISEVTLPRSVDTAEVTSFGDNDRNYIAGLRSGTISVTGMFASTYEEKVATMLASSKTNLAWVFGPAGNASGRTRRKGQAIVTGYEVGAPVADKVSMKIDLQITGAVSTGTF